MAIPSAPPAPTAPKAAERGFFGRLALFLQPVDGRFEDLRGDRWYLGVLRDFTAGLIVAMVAIPLAMGFAMASGLRPEQGIVGGAVAGLVGALFGGSKYQVYGPTAAFIPVIAAVMAKYDHGFLVLAAFLAGLILVLLGLFRAGPIVRSVPHSIIVGFTIGIAVTIAFSQGGEILGLQAKLGYGFIDKVKGIAANIGEVKASAVIVALSVFAICKIFLKISVYIPGPIIGVIAGTVMTMTVFKDAGLARIKDKFGAIPTDFWVVTPPDTRYLASEYALDLAYFALAIVFVSAIESLLCSRMADRLADNRGQPFNPDKELWGQGLVQVFVPLLNGFPHTGALARTATNIRLGAVSPLAGIFKCVLKLLLAAYLATYLELVPMACIGGILLYIATNMVKKEEVTETISHGRFHVALMLYTAAAVIVTDFLTGVLTALGVYAVGRLFFKEAVPTHEAPLPAPIRPTRTIRAEIAREDAPATKRGHADPVPVEHRNWILNLRERVHVASSAFVHPRATLIGRVVLGEHVHIAAEAAVRADEGSPFFIGPGSNIQDGVILHALKHRYVRVGGEDWAIFIGKNVSVAHGAIVHGPSYVGDDTFIGFRAVVHDAVVGAGCFIGIGAIVVGVELPAGRFVPPGSVIDSKEKVAKLGAATEGQHEFNHDVVEVNRGLAAAYRAQVAWDAAAPGHGNGNGNGNGNGRLAAAVAGGARGWEPPRPASSNDRF